MLFPDDLIYGYLHYGYLLWGIRYRSQLKADVLLSSKLQPPTIDIRGTEKETTHTGGHLNGFIMYVYKEVAVMALLIADEHYK